MLSFPDAYVSIQDMPGTSFSHTVQPNTTILSDTKCRGSGTPPLARSEIHCTCVTKRPACPHAPTATCLRRPSSSTAAFGMLDGQHQTFSKSPLMATLSCRDHGLCTRRIIDQPFRGAGTATERGRTQQRWCSSFSGLQHPCTSSKLVLHRGVGRT